MIRQVPLNYGIKCVKLFINESVPPSSPLIFNIYAGDTPELYNYSL